jgi:glycerophosphoryl diester phosphodiesterase
MNYAQTQRYDVGLRQHPRFPQQHNQAATKPLLASVIDSAEAHAKAKGRPLPFYNIETKSTPATDGTHHPDPANFVRLLMQVIQAKGITDRVIIQSFDFRTLQVLHQQYPGVRTAALIDGSDRRGLQEQIDRLGFAPDIYSPFFGLVNQQLVADCHQRKISIIPWTVNDLATLRKLTTMGVDGIISDYPNLFLQLK